MILAIRERPPDANRSALLLDHLSQRSLTLIRIGVGGCRAALRPGPASSRTQTGEAVSVTAPSAPGVRT